MIDTLAYHRLPWLIDSLRMLDSRLFRIGMDVTDNDCTVFFQTYLLHDPYHCFACFGLVTMHKSR